jgi:uncharacterized protein (TIGR00369 family)
MLNADELQQYLADIFPAFNARIVSLDPDRTVLELATDDGKLRPGGTISGPTLMALADAAMYAAILARIGRVALAVTTNLNINFYRKPAPGTLRAEVRILKLGQRLAVGDVLLFSNDAVQSVAHASVTYSIPPAAQASNSKNEIP